MRRIFFVLLLSIYMFGCHNTQYKSGTDEQLKTQVYHSPEELIEEYYTAIKMGDEVLLNNLFIGDEGLRLEKSITGIRYRIRGSRLITEEEATERNSTSSKNKLQKGDLEVLVEEILNKNTEEITFILRKVNSRWKIYSHSIGYYI